MRTFLRNEPEAFDPDTIDIMAVALDEAWRQVQADKATYQINGDAEGARDALAKHIVNLVRQGEHDVLVLLRGALDRLKL